MNALVRPLQWVGTHALRAIELRVQSALLPWSQDWLSTRALEPVLRLARPETPAQAGRYELHANDGGRVWFRHDEADDIALAAALLGVAPTGQWRDRVFGPALAEARQARNQAIAEMLIGPHSEPIEGAPDPRLAAFGSGAVQIEGDAIGLWAVADDGALRHVPPREAAPAAAQRPMPLDRTLRSAPLHLDVTLGSVELELGPLLGLGVGDVIRLPTRLTDGMAVTAGGQRVATGRLGMHDGRRAVQLVAVGDKGSERR